MFNANLELKKCDSESQQYLDRNKSVRYVVTGYCCISGNCGKCHSLGFGRRVRTVKICTYDLTQAKRVLHNWREYKSVLVDRELNTTISED